jgi:aryl-alcohol dehydrogenase-like predicted oxidoreductase
MLYNQLPHTDLNVSRICIGTMTFGDRVDAEEARRCCDLAIDRGVNFFDTADIYPPGPGLAGKSEELLGAALKGKRDKVVVATKVGGAMDFKSGKAGLKKDYVIGEAEDSLRRLGTDYIDIYYAHFPDNAVGCAELIGTMNQLIRAGKIRYYGLSNFSAWRLCEMVLTAHDMGLRPPVVTQSVYNMLTRGVEEEVMPFAETYDFGMVAFNPLAGGMLSGKYQKGFDVEGSRFALQKGYKMRYYSDVNRQAVEALEDIAGRLDVSLIELAYRWLLSHKRLHAALMGFSSEAQLKSNLDKLEAVRELDFPTEEIDRIWKDLTGNRFSYHH